MSRFYVPPEAVARDEIVIKGPEAHHIIDVMRLKKLDKVVAFDGTGAEYVGFIKETKRDSVIVKVVERRRPSSKAGARVTLIQAIPKKEKMDYVVEKATELGAASVMPVFSSRTVPRWDEPKRRAHVARWRRIAKEASKQCGRADIPAVDEIRDFDSVARDAADYDLALIGALSDEAMELRAALADFRGGKIAVAIGPEGDFTDQEVAAAKQAGFKLISLGPRVLKSDTAGLAALAILNYELTR